MGNLPTGTVTFLFTDIEGSTKLAQGHPDKWESLRERHHTILKSVVEVNNGYIFQIIGDAFCVAFHTAGEALRSAIDSQLKLHNENWGDTPIKVRMGIHTGKAEIQAGGDYHGYVSLSRVQRIMSAAHGGQVLISLATEELIRDELPEGVALKDMGERRLKDLIRSEHIYQLVMPNLPADFLPLKTLDAYHHNLPAQMTSFIGREKELAEIGQAISQHRLVTLTGSGGTGKTRLSLQVASEVMDRFPDGVWLLELAQISDAALVPYTLSNLFDVRESGDSKESITELIVEYFRSRNTLIMFDNCEHLIEASARLVDMLVHSCKDLQILATSREALGVQGELVYRVPSLDIPDIQLNMNDLMKCESARLFLERAQDASPSFSLVPDNAPSIAQICSRLDGIPLAIELAAARVTMLSVQQIAKRLDDRFHLLTSGLRTALPHQQTLRALIDWSYNLLSDEERTLLRRLAVFVGGWTLEAAESVCSGRGIESEQVLDLMTQLVNKSLVVVDSIGEEPRYHSLETIRQYAREKLSESGENELLCQRHLEFFVRVAEQAGPELISSQQTIWLNRLQLEHENMRAALDWSDKSVENVELGLQLSGLLVEFWSTRGYFREGRERLIKSLERTQGSNRFDLRGKAFIGIAQLAYRQSDYPSAKKFAGQALALFKSAGDKHGIALALDRLGNVSSEEGDYETAPKMFEEALAIRRDLNDTRGMASSLINLGWAALRPGNYTLANSRLEEALELHRQLGDKNGIAMALSGLSEVAVREGDLGKASQLIEASLAIRKEIGYKWGIGVSYGTWAWIAMRQRDWRAASERLRESATIRKEIGDKGGLAWCLERLAEIALELHSYERSATIFGAASALRASIGSVIDPADQPAYQQNITSLRDHLGDVSFQGAWKRGAEMTQEQAIALALEE